MKPELRARVIAFNKSVKEKEAKASDMDVLVTRLLELPYGQLKKVLTEEILAIFRKYGIGASNGAE